MMMSLRRALFRLTTALIAVAGMMFISTVAIACDARPSMGPRGAMAMSGDLSSCPDAPDVSCQKACLLFCHGLIAAPPEPPRTMSMASLRYRHVATDRESFRHEAEDPPPRV
jgi:hypothetical protein